MKQWIDQVFLSGFAYGDGGGKLAGKSLMVTITTGGTKERYANQTGFTLPELLKPFEYTAQYCGIEYQPPFVVESGLHDQDLQQEAQHYASFLTQYVQGEVSHANTL